MRPSNGMSPNKQTVQRYMAAFAQSDHAGVLACLHDDVEWIVPGAFHLKGKPAFDTEIENPAFVGRPAIAVSRLIEETAVSSPRYNADPKAGRHDIEPGLLRRLRAARRSHHAADAYLMEVPEST